MLTTLQRTPARRLIIFIAATLLLATGDSMAIEEPAFDLIEKTDAIEIRQYRPLIVAEAVVDGAMDTASSRGFRLIAAYIFGGNQSVTPKADKTSEKIAMTAPVVVEPLTSSEKIEMTAPVTVTPEGTLPEPGMQANRWRIQFVMPATYSMATLPKPTNPAVSLREVPAKRYAVIVFSGLAGKKTVQEKTAALLASMRTHKLEPLGAPRLARYDPPWTLPFFRRNEILIEIAASQ